MWAVSRKWDIGGAWGGAYCLNSSSRVVQGDKRESACKLGTGRIFAHKSLNWLGFGESIANFFWRLLARFAKITDKKQRPDLSLWIWKVTVGNGDSWPWKLYSIQSCLQNAKPSIDPERLIMRFGKLIIHVLNVYMIYLSYELFTIIL